MPKTIREYENPPRVDYTEDELEQRSQIMVDARHANNQRAQSYTELDDMDYETWYYRAKKASQGYIMPKRNEEEVKVVTGTTREKGNTLVNTFLNYNLEADVIAYDEKNLAVNELGEVMEKMIRKSRKLEAPDYEIKRPLIYLELINQGNVFIREAWDEYAVTNKEIEDKKALEEDEVRLDKLKWKEKLQKVYSQCNSILIPGLEMFPGNIREFFMELQPYVITRRVVSYTEAESMYGNWERFKNVSKFLERATEIQDNNQRYDDWQMIETEVDLVEVIEYFNKWTNTYQIMLNGVLMLPVGFPLSIFTGLCEYPFSKGDNEPISPNFFYSRGIGSKTRMDQAIIDEMFKMMIIKTRKSYKPPLANKGNYNIGPSVYMPGKIFKGIDPEKLQPIGDATGVTPAEFNMTQFVKSVIDEKTVDPIAEGQAPEKKATARQVMIQQHQSMVKMGMAMLGVVNLEKRMAWLRLNNILRHWTEPIDERIVKTKDGVKTLNKYRNVTVEGSLDDGQEGMNIIEFTDNVPVTQQVLAEEKIIEQTRGQKVKKYYLDAEELRSLKYTWEINITPTEKNSSMLKAAMFNESLQQMLAIFAPLGKVPNMDYLGDRWAVLNDEDPEQVWTKQPPAMPGMPPQGVPPGAAPPQQKTAQATAPTKPMPKPSINTLAEA